MKGIFGLAGVLVVIGVIVWWMSQGGLEHTSQTIKTGQNAQEQVRQIAGQDPSSGERAAQSAVLEGMMNGNRLTGLLVARVTEDGAYAKYFGIRRNDTIVAAEYQGTRMDMKTSNDETMAKAWVEEAFRKQGAVYVVRDSKELKLPPPPAPGQPAKTDSIQRQLDSIPGVR